MSQEYVTGIFKREEKNRFLCTVCVKGKYEECYIPSSCRLGNFLEPTGKRVLLKENQNKNARTRFAVYAMRFKQNYIILRTSEANDIVFNSLKSRRFSYLGKRLLIEKEKVVDGYKADIYIPETKTILEIKSIITVGKNAVFPTVYSERALEQLKKIKELLLSGYKFAYVFVSLNPYVDTVQISKETEQSEYMILFSQCISRGMICKAYTVRLESNGPRIFREIPLSVAPKKI